VWTEGRLLDIEMADALGNAAYWLGIRSLLLTLLTVVAGVAQRMDPAVSLLHVGWEWIVTALVFGAPLVAIAGLIAALAASLMGSKDAWVGAIASGLALLFSFGLFASAGFVG
jgi:uncharacterized membrane protein YkvI